MFDRTEIYFISIIRDKYDIFFISFALFHFKAKARNSAQEEVIHMLRRIIFPLNKLEFASFDFWKSRKDFKSAKSNV